MSIRSVRWPSACFAPPGGDGASAGPGVEPGLARKAGVLIREETGIRFEPLVLFAEPLFEHFDLDAGDAFALKHHPQNADQATVAALEAARVLWAYFSLPDERRESQFHDLADYLLGPVHSPEDDADLELLLDQMAQQWRLLTPEDRRVAEQTAASTLDFEALLVHPALGQGRSLDAPDGGYGPERISELEAQALFAQPMLNRAEDPDEMEASLERAHAFWEIAHGDADEREAALIAYLDGACTTRKHRERLESEARDMMARFDELFPEHAA